MLRPIEKLNPVVVPESSSGQRPGAEVGRGVGTGDLIPVVVAIAPAATESRVVRTPPARPCGDRRRGIATLLEARRPARSWRRWPHLASRRSGTWVERHRGDAVWAEAGRCRGPACRTLALSRTSAMHSSSASRSPQVTEPTLNRSDRRGRCARRALRCRTRRSARPRRPRPGSPVLGSRRRRLRAPCRAALRATTSSGDGQQPSGVVRAVVQARAGRLASAQTATGRGPAAPTELPAPRHPSDRHYKHRPAAAEPSPRHNSDCHQQRRELPGGELRYDPSHLDPVQNWRCTRGWLSHVR